MLKSGVMSVQADVGAVTEGPPKSGEDSVWHHISRRREAYSMTGSSISCCVTAQKLESSGGGKMSWPRTGLKSNPTRAKCSR